MAGLVGVTGWALELCRLSRGGIARLLKHESSPELLVSETALNGESIAKESSRIKELFLRTFLQIRTKYMRIPTGLAWETG